VEVLLAQQHPERGGELPGVEPAEPREAGGKGVLVASPASEPLTNLLVIHQIVGGQAVGLADKQNPPGPAGSGFIRTPAQFPDAQAAVPVWIAKVLRNLRQLLLNFGNDLVAKPPGRSGQPVRGTLSGNGGIGGPKTAEDSPSPPPNRRAGAPSQRGGWGEGETGGSLQMRPIRSALRIITTAAPGTIHPTPGRA
jgi:hypothetical protein